MIPENLYTLLQGSKFPLKEGLVNPEKKSEMLLKFSLLASSKSLAASWAGFGANPPCRLKTGRSLLKKLHFISGSSANSCCIRCGFADCVSCCNRLSSDPTSCILGCTPVTTEDVLLWLDPIIADLESFS